MITPARIRPRSIFSLGLPLMALLAGSMLLLAPAVHAAINPA